MQGSTIFVLLTSLYFYTLVYETETIIISGKDFLYLLQLHMQTIPPEEENKLYNVSLKLYNM